MPPALYLSYTLNLVCNIVWLILWDREYMPAALGVIILLVLSLVVCLFLSYRAVLISLPALTRYKLTKEVSSSVHQLSPAKTSPTRYVSQSASPHPMKLHQGAMHPSQSQTPDTCSKRNFHEHSTFLCTASTHNCILKHVQVLTSGMMML